MGRKIPVVLYFNMKKYKIIPKNELGILKKQ